MRRHWKKFLWGGLCLLCLIGFWLLYRGDQKTAGALITQQAAERWETEEKPYAMASVFLTPDQAVPDSRIGEIYLSVENALTAGSVGSEDHPWVYAASYHTDATLKNGTVSCQVELTAVAGDFFQIHPFPLLSGWYMDQGELMRDRIVLDRQAAWDLFYSDNVSGQYVTVDDVQYEIAAVVDIRQDEYSELAAGDTRRAWVFADSPALSGNPADSQAATPTAHGYTCVEMVLPQPVKNFAASTLKTALGDMIPDSTPITDNTNRFALSNRWNILRNFTTRGISSDAVPYPFWENAARLVENHLALRLIPEGVLLGIPAISLLILLLWLNHRRTWGLHSLKDLAENLVDRRRQRVYAARLSGEERKRLPGHVSRKDTRRSRRQRSKALRYSGRQSRPRRRR